LIFGEHEDDSKIRRENAVRNFEVEIKLLKNKAIKYELKFKQIDIEMFTMTRLVF
jgi:predicted transposase YbfD/YdcC